MQSIWYSSDELKHHRDSILAKSYRAQQQWGHWLTQFLGQMLLEQEMKLVSELFAARINTSAVLIGVPQQNILLKATSYPRQYLLGPLLNRDKSIRYIEGEFYDLPILTGSVDLVILPHALEFLDNPHKLLSEACRIVKPEGSIVIFGFNPISLWGLKKKWVRSKGMPWSGNFIDISTIKKWLALADFELEKQDTIIFRPPVHRYNWYHKLRFIEWLGRKLFKPFGAVYMLKAKAKLIPLTPIRMHWKQKLPGLSATIGTMPRPSTRNQS